MNGKSHGAGRMTSRGELRRFGAHGIMMSRPGAMKSVGVGSLAVIAGLSIAAWTPVAVALNAVIN